MYLFNEADSIERKYDMYGRRILSNLALTYAKIGDMTKAKICLDKYDKSYGHHNGKEDELDKLATA